MVAKRCVAALALLLAAAPTLAIAPTPAAAQFEEGWLSGARRPPPRTQRPPGRTSQQSAIFRRNSKDRFVVGLYDGSSEGGADLTRLHRYLELPLNHLGLTIRYHDVSQGLPDTAALARARGIVTWFDRSVPNHRAYFDWAAKTAAEGVRFAILDAVGMPQVAEDIEAANTFLNALGVRMTARWVGNSQAGHIIEQNAAMIGFERKLASNLPGYMVVELQSPSGRTQPATSHLTLLSRKLGGAEQARSSVVTTGPGGGLALTGYVRQFDAATGRLAWVIDPFAFLTAALDLPREPVPDTTTLVGRRMYFNHVDGDGWTTPVGGGPIAAEAIARSVIERHPDRYVSVGLIAADTMPAQGGSLQAAAVARRIFALPHVEPASSTYSSPIDWQFLQHYDRGRELARVFAARSKAIAVEQRALGALAKLGRHRYSALVRRGFMVRSRVTPRGRMLQAFGLDREVKGALALTTSLAPQDKPARLYMWSGTKRPFEAAVAAVRDSGACDINGGGGRLDRDYPSLMYLAPLSRPVGNQQQIYAVNSSDLAYTAGWRSSPDQFAKLAETWRNTDAPRRLKPMSLNYHMYSGARTDAIEVLNRLNELVAAETVVPVSTSQYAQIAEGFMGTKIFQLGPNRWRISNRGALSTVRFDDAEKLHLDQRSSDGVLGYTHHGTALYVALDPARRDAIVAVTPATPDDQRAERPFLVESRWQISDLKTGSCGLEANARGLGQGDMTWAGLRPGRYEVATSREGEDAAVHTREVGEGKTLKLSLEADAGSGLTLKISCLRDSSLATSSTGSPRR